VTAGKIGAALKTLAAQSNEVLSATEFDREGELIGVEALALIREQRLEIRVRRARFSALTKWDIVGAFANLVDVDYPLAASAESRQSVDLAWGAVLTRFISIASKQLGRDFLSVGRVQSPTLALIVDREREIENFVPQDFWTVHAKFRKDVAGAHRPEPRSNGGDRPSAHLPGPRRRPGQIEAAGPLADLRARRAPLPGHGGAQCGRGGGRSQDRSGRPGVPGGRLPGQGTRVAQVLSVLGRARGHFATARRGRAP